MSSQWSQHPDITNPITQAEIEAVWEEAEESLRQEGYFDPSARRVEAKCIQILEKEQQHGVR